MPIIGFNSVTRSKNTYTKFINPIIGKFINCITSEDKPQYIRDISDYYARIGIPDSDTEYLLNSDYSLKILSKYKGTEYHKYVRLYEGTYGYPIDKSVIKDTTDKNNVKLDNLSNLNTYSIKFPINFKPNLDNNDFVILTTDTRRGLIQWTSTGQVTPRAHNCELIITDNNDYTERVAKFLREQLGFGINYEEDGIVAYKLHSFSNNYLSNRYDLDISISDYGNSQVVNQTNKCLIDIESKHCRYTNDLYIDIYKLYDNCYTISVKSNGQSFESFEYMSTEESALKISQDSKFINIKYYSKGELPIGSFYLKGAETYSTELNTTYTNNFSNKPYCLCVYSDELIRNEKEELLIDSNKLWDNNILRTSSEVKIDDTWYSFKSLTLGRFRNKNFFGSIESAEQVRNVISDTNYFENWDYSIDINKLYWYVDGYKSPFLKYLVSRCIYTVLLNNLEGNTNVEPSNIASIFTFLKTFITSINRYTITKWEKVESSLYINLEVYINTYNGVESVLPFNIVINEITEMLRTIPPS